MQIKELYLQNFRCFKELSLKFSPDYTVLIGNNGAGKSSVLDALKIALQSFVEAAQQDLRPPTVLVDSSAHKAIQESDARLKSIPTGSTLDQQSQYPVVVKIAAEIFNGEAVDWNYELAAYLSRKSSGVGAVLKHVQNMQNQISNGEPFNCPLIAYYGTRRQWDKPDKQQAQQIQPLKFIPQMNGYVNSLAAVSFNLNLMRHWFARMLLISRKKTVPEFEAVRRAIADCYKNIDERSNLEKIQIDYDAETEDIEIQSYFRDGSLEFLPLHYLSDGAKSILATVADIAYRMATLNPHLRDAVMTETAGVVLIDELDLHLHPSWQRKIIDSLRRTFPRLQFVFTTHSPTVLTNVPKENIRILHDGIVITPTSNTYGHDVNSILREIMKTEVRPDAINHQFKDFSTAIANENLPLAQNILDSLRAQLGDDDSEIVSSQITLDLEKF